MVKGNKDPIPNISSVQNREIIQRLNFLYQASVYLQNLSQTTLSPASTPVTHEHKHAKKGTQERKRHRQRIRTTDELSRAYIDTMLTVGKKTTVKMDPSIKRTLCKRCQSVLVPGLTVSVRVRKSTSHRHALELTCTFCGFERRIPAPPRTESSTNLAESDLDLCSGVNIEEKVETKDPQEPVVESDYARTEIAGTRKRRRPRKLVKKGTDEDTVPTMKRSYPPLPLALRRDAGHAVFCGNERVEMNLDVINELGDGMFAV
ncbi:RNAse P Rpr2/Rpp21/SNM1 subunit domain containing protein [Amanita muscaria]